ncbi:type VII secretion integral membrane protein EccD [Actinosynnema sp. NPDC053489]|uniref:type VII secretion integral membrane protein EccD n=1 Tax=Actinosynnema sp. NPDC053489 TaxID=3363916 RepID=UPI0037C58056
MSDSTVAGLCRLRVRGPSSSFELAVPADVPLADLLPALVDHAGPGDGEAVEHGGWVLQRLGGAPLDPEATPGGLGLRDGEAVYLRPAHDTLPQVHFDDLVDGVATALRDRSDSWRPQWTYRSLLAGVVLALGLGVLLLDSSVPQPLRVVVAGVVAVLLLMGAAAASRAVGDGAAGTALGAMALPYLVSAGWHLVDGGEPGARVLAGCAAGAGGAVLALAAVGASAPLFLAAALVAGFGAVGAGALLLGQPPVGAAAAVAVGAVLLGPFAPGLAFRLSGLRLPLLPGDADELQTEIEPYPSGLVLDRAAVADHLLTGMHLACGLVCSAALVVPAATPGWRPAALVAAISVLLLVHSRGMGGVWHRLAALVPGTWGAALLALRWGSDGALLALAALLLVAAALAVAAWTAPGRRLLPYWGRAAEVVQLVAAVAVVPLLLLVLGVFDALRALNG